MFHSLKDVESSVCIIFVFIYVRLYVLPLYRILRQISISLSRARARTYTHAQYLCVFPFSLSFYLSLSRARACARVCSLSHPPTSFSRTRIHTNTHFSPHNDIQEFESEKRMLTAEQSERKTGWVYLLLLPCLLLLPLLQPRKETSCCGGSGGSGGSRSSHSFTLGRRGRAGPPQIQRTPARVTARAQARS